MARRKLVIKADESIDGERLHVFINGNRGNARIIFQGRKGLEVSNALVRVAQAIPLAIHWQDSKNGTVATA